MTITQEIYFSRFFSLWCPQWLIEPRQRSRLRSSLHLEKHPLQFWGAVPKLWRHHTNRGMGQGKFGHPTLSHRQGDKKKQCVNLNYVTRFLNDCILFAGVTNNVSINFDSKFISAHSSGSHLVVNHLKDVGCGRETGDNLNEVKLKWLFLFYMDLFFQLFMYFRWKV